MAPPRALALFCFALALSAGALACDLCGCGLSLWPLETLYQPGFQVGLNQQYTDFGSVRQNGVSVPNLANQWLHSSITQLALTYNFDERLGLQLNLPFINRSFQRTTDGGGIQQGLVQGLGDSSLLVRYLPVRRFEDEDATLWTVYGGLKMPTGSPSRIAEEFSEGDSVGVPSAVHGHDLALGSGSWDGLVGTSLYLRSDSFYLTASAQYALRTRGSYGYRYANDFQWSLAPGFYMSDDPDFLAGLQLNVSGESKGLDDLNGVAAGDTGISTVFLGPQLSFSGQDVTGQIALDLPVSIQNTEFQAVPDFRVRAQLNVKF